MTDSGSNIDLVLPWPPSVNTIWRNVVVGRSSRTLLSEAARVYFVEAACAVYAQRDGRRIEGRAKVEITLHPPTRARIDLDNRCKAILDALTKGCIWDDDHQVDELHVKRGQVIKGGKAVVVVSSVEAA